MLLKEVDDANVQITETFDKGKWVTVMINAVKTADPGEIEPNPPIPAGYPRQIYPQTQYEEDDEE